MFGLCSCVQRHEEKPVSDKVGRVTAHRVGRLVFSLPEEFVQLSESLGEFQPVGADNDAPAINFRVAALNVSVDEFSEKVQSYTRELSQEKPNAGLEYLANMKAVGKEMVLVRVGIIKDAYRSEVHALIGNTYIVGSLQSFHDKYDIAEKQLSQFMTGVLPSTEGVDAARGFYVGPVVIHGNFSREWFSMSFRGTAHPDLIVAFDVDTFAKDDTETLFQRVGGPLSLLRIVDLKHQVLRKRELSIGGMRAQEWLGAVKLEGHEKKKYGFALETMRQTPSLTAPKVHIDFDSGKAPPDGDELETSIDDEAALTIWDGLVASIRLPAPLR